MKCQVLFSRKNKKNVLNLSSAELAKRVVKAYMAEVKEQQGTFNIFFLFFIANKA